EIYDAQMPFDTYITDADGKIISHTDATKAFKDSPYKKDLVGGKGSFQKDGQLIAYNYIEDWNWYIVGTLPTSYLLSDTYKVFFTLLILFGVLCAISITISFRLSNSLYRPLKEIVTRMSIISRGDLRTRMNGEYSG
ncbi:MAG TPA: two-component sensor histidine kinase, partial [Clostridia bacterium]|nr:two-component sensor histidine kinase [Clostridia bacterium]